MHWLDAIQNSWNVQTKVQVITEGKPTFSMGIFMEDFAVPSWNRMLAMHRMTKNRFAQLTANIFNDTLIGEDGVQNEVDRMEYEMYLRPNQKRKEAWMQRKEQVVYRKRKGLDQPTITERPAEFNKKVSIKFNHFRKRLIDVDNLCCKPLLDAVVRSGLLPDDGPRYVQSVQHCQRKMDEFPRVTGVPGEMILIEIHEFVAFDTEIRLELEPDNEGE